MNREVEVYMHKIEPNTGEFRSGYVKVTLIRFDGENPVVQFSNGEMMVCHAANDCRYGDTKKKVVLEPNK